MLDEQLAPLADVLKARSAIIALRKLADEAAGAEPVGARELATVIEQVETGAHELVELRLLHLVFTGQVDLTVEEREEVARLVRGGDRPERLGVPIDADVATQKRVALERLEAWRTRAAHPLTPRSAADAYAIIAESYERLYADPHPFASRS